MFGQYGHRGVGADLNYNVLLRAQQSGLTKTLAAQLGPASDASSSGGVTGWWGQQSTGAKVGIGFAAVALVAALGYGVYTVVADDPAPYKANRKSRRARRRRH